MLAFLRRRHRRQRILLFKFQLKKIKRLFRVFLVPTFMAEARGFEPPRPFGPHDFESCAFNHSATLPPLILTKITLNYNRLRANKKFHHHYSILFYLKSLFIKTLPRQNFSHKKNQLRKGTDFLIISFGTPDRIRTYDLLLRKQTLYPAELRVHV